MRGVIFDKPTTSRRYNLTFGMSDPQSAEPQQPRARSSATSLRRSSAAPIRSPAAPNGEGFSENANNRRLELQIRFVF